MKYRLAFIFLILFATWPAVHHGLVRTMGLSPWKFFGWSMYCVPKREVRFEITLEDADGAAIRVTSEQIVQYLGTLDSRDPIHQLMRRTMLYCRWYGPHYAPDVLGTAILKSRMGLTRVTIDVIRLKLDASTERFVAEHRAGPYVYDAMP